MSKSKFLNKNLHLFGAGLSLFNSRSQLSGVANNIKNNMLGINSLQNEIDSLYASINTEVDRCKINGIELEWVQVKSDERSGTVKTHTLEDQDNTLISSNVANGNRKYSIHVILTNHSTNNPDEIYQNIVEFWKNKTLCTLSTLENIEDIVITKVSRIYQSENAYEFDLDFEVLEFAYLMKKGEVAEKNKTILSEEKETGTAGTKQTNIKYGGFL